MQAVSGDYGCFVTSTGRHRGRGGGRPGATVLLRGPASPRLAAAPWRYGGWNLAGGYQVRVRRAGGGPALQDGWIRRDLGHRGRLDWLLLMRRTWTRRQGQRRWAHRARCEVDWGGGGDRRGTRHHRAGRAGRRVYRAHCLVHGRSKVVRRRPGIG